MVNKDLRKALFDKLGIKPPAMSERVSRIKIKYGPTTTELATYLLAYQVGIDIAKYLDDETVEKVRQLRQHLPTFEKPRGQQKISAGQSDGSVVVNLGAKVSITDPVLPKHVLSEASKMAEIYPLFYIFENSVREVIVRVMQAKYGSTWWDKVPGKIRRDVDARIADEENNPWHGKRKSHGIYYTDIKDLIGIVNDKWDDFKNVFPSLHWFSQEIEVISRSRNIVAHNNPLSEKDARHLRTFFEIWYDQIESKRNLIP
jgi:hypothetical protein